MKPIAADLLEETYDQFVSLTRSIGAKPIAMYLPRPEFAQPDFISAVAEQKGIANEAGFTLLDVSNAYASMEDPSTLWLARWDRHPGPAGHELLADKFYEQLTEYLNRNSMQ